MISRRPIFLLAFALMLTQCASNETSQETANAIPGASSAPGIIAQPAPVSRQLMVPENQAEEFDKFLRDVLSPEQVAQLKVDCDLDPEANMFCYAIVNREILEYNLDAVNKVTTPKIPWVIRPRFVRHKIRNWTELRNAPVGSLIRGVSGLKSGDLEKLAKLSLSEAKCPNNIAIAVATEKEESLPNKVTPTKIANLYKAGANCIVNNPVDKETILTRAGLFYYLGKKYDDAEKALVQASQLKDVYVGRALYWLFRTRQIRDTAAANSALSELKTRYPFSFHSIIATIANNEDPGDVLKKTGNPKLTRSVRNPKVNALIESVEALKQFNYQESAAKVLDWAIAETQEAEPELRIYLAELKPEDADFRSRITLLSDLLYKNPGLISKQTMELYFPKAYFPIFEKNTSGLDPYLLMSVARQESAFNPRAISSANARGLLQLDPKTGRRYQHRPPPDLMDPKTNISIASRYLFDILKRVNGQIYFALAAYNAGENRLFSWMNRYPTTEPILFIDLIPYHETRDYVASVLRNYYWYRKLDQRDDANPPKPIFQVDLSSN
jgi:soluble lytic murein transglycosylase